MTGGVRDLAALPVAIPLLTAALIVITSSAPRRVHDVMAIVCGAATTTLAAILLAHTQSGPIVYWLGGWQPHHGVALGIAMTIDQLGAGMATFTAGLVTVSFVYAWRFFDEIDGLFHALMLAFLAGVIGFFVSGDLFNMIVFFAMSGVAAFALTAVKVEQRGPIQGAINFAVINSIAAFSLLMAVGLVYGRTGALNLMQIDAALGHHADALVAVGFALLVLAFLTRAAVVPLHFWLDDAFGVAPAPVCAVFAAVAVQLGLFGVARLAATAFATPLAGHEAAVRAILVGVGLATLAVAAVQSFEQRHVKRLLAFATVAQVGVLLCAVALLDGRALGAAAIYAVGSGLALATLFMAAGALLRRYGTIDEYELHACGRDLPVLGIVFAVGGLLLTWVPLGTTYFGAGLLGDVARRHGYGFLPFVLAAGSALTGAAVLRVAGRVFLGWGPERRVGDESEHSEERSQEASAEEEGEEFETRERSTVLLVGVPALVLAAAVVAGLVPGLVPSFVRAGAHFRDHAVYSAAVLHGAAHAFAPVTVAHVGGAAVAFGCATTAVALAIAGLGLFGRPLAERGPRRLIAVPTRVVDGLRALHDGHVGDYVAWWTFGVTVIGGLFLWTIAG